MHKPVNLSKPVSLAKRRTLTADQMVMHGVPANANGKHRRLVRAV